MDEAIKNIRQELLALKTCLSKTQALKDAIKRTDDPTSLKALVKETDDALLALSEAANLKAKFLDEKKYANMKEYLEAQELSEKRDVSLRLLMQVGKVQKELSSEVDTVKELLKRASGFIDYRMNVLSGVKADTTYGSTNSLAGQKMFDANI